MMLPLSTASEAKRKAFLKAADEVSSAALNLKRMD